MLKRFLLVVMALAAVCVSQAQFKKNTADVQRPPEWNDKDIFEQHRVYPRANVTNYKQEDGIEKWSYRESPYRISLNGKWQMDLQDNYDSRPQVEAKKFKPNGWTEVQVPLARWSVGVGKSVLSPKLTSVVEIPTRNNSVATYYREFKVPKSWTGLEAFLQLQAKSAAYVWVNQAYVGYSEDSRSMAEYNITKHLKVGKTNSIVVMVMSASDGSLMEMNAERECNGIIGDVAVLLKPAANVQDYRIRSDYNATTKEGTFTLTAEVFNRAKKGRYYMEVEIWTPQGKELEKMGKWVVFDKRDEMKAAVSRSFVGVQPWSAEHPNLYTAVVRLRDEEMKLVETVGTRFGFRTIELKDGLLQVNEVPVTLRGVVYTGWTSAADGLLTRDQMRQDLMRMKQNNINAVRTACYSPLDEYFYEQCDELGLYVVCDANLHPYSGQNKAIATDADYSNLFVARIQNMYERYKNHASIIMWSLGDCVDNGVCMENAYKALKQKDKTRAVVFSGAQYSENTDLIGQTTATEELLKQYLAKSQSRPMVLMGFGSTQGNNYGGVEPMWQLVRDNARLQGGFAAYWNPVRCVNVKNNEEEYHSGLVNAEGKASPLLDELRNIYRPFGVKMINLSPDAGEFLITNYTDCQTMSDYVVEYMIYSNLKPRIIEGDVHMTLNPGEAKTFKLKVPKLMLYAGEELFIRFTTKQRNATTSVPKGQELGVQELALPMAKVAKQPMPDYGRQPLEVKKDSMYDNIIMISNNNIALDFDLEAGEIAEMQFQGETLLSGAPHLCFWRPATDNDRVDKNGSRLWQQFMPNQLRREVVATNYTKIDDYTVILDVMLRYANQSGTTLFDVKQTYLVLYSGDVIIDNSLVASELVKSLPKLGMQLQLPKTLTEAQWFGRNIESYADRNSAAKLSNNTCALNDLAYRYDRPQASGNRMDVRWVSFKNATRGLFVDLIDTVFNFSAYPYDDYQMYTSDSYHVLKEANNWTANIDLLHTGVGSALAGTNMSEDLLINGRKYHFRVHLRPYNCEEYEGHDFCRVLYPTTTSSVLPMPQIDKNLDRFDRPMKITITSPDTKAEIHYTLDGQTPTEKSPLYTKPFMIQNSTVVKARTFKKGATPSFTTAKQFNFDYIVSAQFDNKANTPYNYNADKILFDGEMGDISDLSRGWIGFSGSDLSVTLALGKAVELDQVKLRFAHVPEAWVFAPQEVLVSVSSDGVTFSEPVPAIITYNPASEEMNSAQLVTIKVEVNAPNVKYVKVVARNMGKIPKWHKAKGLRSWIMTDEVELDEVIK